MNNMTPKRLTDLDFWKSNAPCYPLWLQRDNCYAPIKDFLAARFRLEWWTRTA